MTALRRRVQHRLLGLAHALLQRVVPASDDRVVFTSIPDHTDNSFAVYRHLLRTRRNLHVTWIVVDTSARPRIEQEFAAITATLPGGHGHRLSVHSRHHWRGYLSYLRARVAFHTHGVFAFARSDHRRHVVSLWHGMPIKAIGLLNSETPSEHTPHGTTHLATSEMFRYIIGASFGVDPDSVVLTTLPRTDALLADPPDGPNSREVRTRLGLHPDRHLIFWMPTYRTQVNAQFVIDAYRLDAVGAPRTFLDDVPTELMEELDRACGEQDCQVVIKLHPLDALNHESRRLGFENIRLLTSDEFLASGLQLYDVLAQCDALMSDVSSVLIDFVPTRRPIGLIGLPFEVYERNLLLPLHLFVDSERFDHLSGPDHVAAFVASVAAGCQHPGDSFTSLLHAEFDDRGSERVLRHAGL